MENANKIFDSSYIGAQATSNNLGGKSKVKEFLKSPVVEEDLKRYGINKPIRMVIRATIKND